MRQVSRCTITVILEQEHFQSFPEHWQWNVQQTEIGWKTDRSMTIHESHVLHQLLPEKTNCIYNLRSRQHDRQLTMKSTHINDSLFFIRMLYEDAYWWFMWFVFSSPCRNFCLAVLFRCVLSTFYIRIYAYGYGYCLCLSCWLVYGKVAQERSLVPPYELMWRHYVAVPQQS